MDYEIIYKLSESQIKDLHLLFQEEWWTKERTLTDVCTMVENSSLIIGICNPINNELIGFARVLTDYIYKALILDVIVSHRNRGKKLGVELMELICNHPSLKEVKHFELYCKPEMIAFYRKWGFSEKVGELNLLRLVNHNGK